MIIGILVLSIVIIGGVLAYARYAVEKTPSIMGGGYDRNMIHPYNFPVSYEKGQPIKFKDFTLTSLGRFGIVSEGGEVASVQTDDYIITDLQGKEERLKIGNGQLPNPPYEFVVGSTTFTLWTYKDKQGVKLESGKLEITTQSSK